jgi:hypothetical protein
MPLSLILIIAVGAGFLLIASISWQSPLTPASLLQMGGLVLCIAVTWAVVRYWWRGRQGLDQWPSPYGRFYDEWMRLDDVGNYYPWLAKKMNWREPWATWAKAEPDDDAQDS